MADSPTDSYADLCLKHARLLGQERKFRKLIGDAQILIDDLEARRRSNRDEIVEVQIAMEKETYRAANQ